jgi:4-hydroxy-2-oxoglutarate aldolase
VEKVAAMVQGTRNIKRTATVTEVFQAVTARMVAAPAASHEGNGNQLVSVGGPGGSETATQTVARPRFKTRTKEVGFQVLVGAAPTIFASFQAGASGAVLALAAPAPTICFEIFAAWKDNDLELARAKQESISAASRRVVSELGIAAVKHAMDVNGYYGGAPRLPLLPLTAAQKSEVELVMASCRN